MSDEEEAGIVYHVYSGTGRNGEAIFMAVNDDAINEAKQEEEYLGPGWFFPPHSRDIQESGSITISGDTNLLPDYFSLK